MTHVLMTADTVGGVWTYALELIDALAPHHVHVTLALLGPAPNEGQRRQLASSAVHDTVEYHGALEWMDDPWDDVDAAGVELLTLAGRVGADLVHHNGFVHASLPWGQPVVVVAHSDVASWWHHVHGGPAPPTLETYRRRVQRGLRDASAVVVLTESGRRDLRREYGLDRATCIPNGRRGDWVRIRPKEPLVLGAGRLWDDAKNVQALEVAAAGLDWPVLVAGDGPPAPPRGRTHLLGPLGFDELATWMARAAIFAAPARYEPFGLGALEAGLSGCALVLGDIDTAHELWGDAAVYVDPEDPAALHEVLQSMCRDPRRCRRLGRRARARARRFSADTMASAYVSLYESLLVPSREPA
jgi:glycosyltransferase involved in cell wall biosynthesis